MNVSSVIELYDSDIRAIDQGPLKWAADQQGTRRDLDDFVRGLVGRFDEIGLRTRVNTYDTSEAGTFAFEIVIQGRHEEQAFDYDRQVHEVRSGVLQGEPTEVIKPDWSELKDAPKHKH